MRLLLVLATLSLAGCGSAADEAKGSADGNQIARLARPKVVRQDPSATARLQTLTNEDLEREGLTGAGCAFRREGRLLLAAVGSDSLVRISGQRRHLIHSAPVGATGGFFEDRQISVSVGRTDANGAPGDGGMTWPARLKVVNHRTEAEVELHGFWTCGS